MPLLALPFPAFDPVLIPHRAVRDPLVRARLYRRHPARLALCARADPQRAAVGRAGAADASTDFDDFIAVGDARHHPRRPHRLCAVLQSGAFRRASARGRSNCGRAACRSTAASPAASLAVVLFARRRGIPILSLGDLTCAVGPIGLFLGRLANFINGELWGRPTDVPWAMVFPGGGPLPRHPSQLYEAALEGLVLFVVLCAADARRRAEAAGLRHRRVCRRLCGGAHRLRILPRARSRSSASCGAG